MKKFRVLELVNDEVKYDDMYEDISREDLISDLNENVGLTMDSYIIFDSEEIKSFLINAEKGFDFAYICYDGSLVIHYPGQAIRADILSGETDSTDIGEIVSNYLCGEYELEEAVGLILDFEFC